MRKIAVYSLDQECSDILDNFFQTFLSFQINVGIDLKERGISHRESLVIPNILFGYLCCQAMHVSTTKPNRYRGSLAVRISHAWSQFHVRLGNVVQRKLWFIHGNLFVHGHANEDDPLTHGGGTVSSLVYLARSTRNLLSVSFFSRICQTIIGQRTCYCENVAIYRSDFYGIKFS